ncbi:MAG: DUF4340 domain-containing protein, partial [Oscillospiraceae bacterium]|nr:DUF4340 domain-containing protein [Oscillospiraceae bacterium]
MSRKIKTLIIAAAVLLFLGAALAVVLIMLPERKESVSSGDITSNILDFLGEDGEQITVLLNRSADEVLKMSVSNEKGGYVFDRMQRGEEYYWKTDALGEVTPDEAAIRRFIGFICELSGTVPVEENVSGDGLDKYGLKDPVARVVLSLEDGTGAEISFGIHSPSKTLYVY